MGSKAQRSGNIGKKSHGKKRSTSSDPILSDRKKAGKTVGTTTGTPNNGNIPLKRSTMTGILTMVLSVSVAALAIFWKSTAGTGTQPAAKHQYTDQQQPLEEPAKHTVAEMGEFYTLLEVLDHDATSFTQGLEYDIGTSTFLEGTGIYGQSVMRLWSYSIDHKDRRNNSTTIHDEISLDKQYFGEGICSYVNGTLEVGSDIVDESMQYIIQLTWKEQTAVIYKYLPSNRTLKQERIVSYTTHTTEGWGIAFNAKAGVFYVTDGSQYVHVWNATTLEEIQRFPVTLQLEEDDDGDDDENDDDDTQDPLPVRVVSHLNEVEYDFKSNTLLANIWYQNAIVRIDINSGQVTKVYDFSSLYTNRVRSADCMNGIAWANDAHTELWLTGKWWPHMYRVRLSE